MKNEGCSNTSFARNAILPFIGLKTYTYHVEECQLDNQQMSKHELSRTLPEKVLRNFKQAQHTQQMILLAILEKWEI